MARLNLNQNQFSDLINITNNVFFPLTNFVNKKDFLTILNHSKFKSKFYPLPIYFGMNRINFFKYKDKKKLDLFYKSKIVAKINKISFFSVDKNIYGKKIYGKNFKKHPYFKKFYNENYRFLSFEIEKNYNYKLNQELFIKPEKFIKKIKTKNLAGFHTRNVPHKAHQWIHKMLIKKYKSLLIQPLIGQYKKGEYYDKIIMKLNSKTSKCYKNKNVHVLPFFSYPRYGGPREAALHAIVRKNYGCTHFWVGRDHAGYGEYFNKYESQIFCKKNEKKIKIKIISEKEPYYCKNINCITNSCKCKKDCKIQISGTKIRKLIIQNRKIPNIFMSENISKHLNKYSLINN